MLVSADAERRYVQAIFARLSCSPDEADATAEVLTEGDLRGHGSHGLSRVPLYAGMLRSGHLRAGAQPRVIDHRPAVNHVHQAPRYLRRGVCQSEQPDMDNGCLAEAGR